MICAFVELPDGLEPEGPLWDGLRRGVDAARPDILVVNEMPFGPWLAGAARYNAAAAERSLALHERGLAALAGLGVPAVLGSRPVRHGDRLANEAFALEGGIARPLHRKQCFPEEDGWYEATWFEADGSGFAVHTVAGLQVGVLLCTELMFNEHARRYGRAGADLIVAPRATGLEQHSWGVAGAMAALVSGAYVVSSNRAGSTPGAPVFGGRGFAVAPDGTLLGETSRQAPLAAFALDPDRARRQKREYPCYVEEAPQRR